MAEIITKGSKLYYNDVIISVETITPDQAQAMLGKNTHNRNVRPQRVKNLTAALGSDEWRFNGDAIRIAFDGTLIDGQHRLLACIESGEPIICIVVRGLEMEAQETIDIGAKRTVADALRLENFRGGATLGSALVLINSWTTRGLIMRPKGGNGGANLSPMKAVELAKSLTDIESALENTTRGDLKSMFSPSVSVAMTYLTSRVDQEASEEFWRGVIYGENLLHQDPRMALRRRLTKIVESGSRRGDGKSSAFAQASQAFIALSAWNNFFPDRKNRTNFQLPESISNPELWPAMTGDTLRLSAQEA